jgi:uncharacterized protein
MRRGLFALVSVMLCACSPAFADDASELAKARALLVATKVDELQTKAFDTMLTLQAPQLGQQLQLQDGETQRFLTDVREAWWRQSAAMLEEIAKVYVEEFSEAELDAMLAFYATPAGQALVDKQPRIFERSTALGADAGMKTFQDAFTALQARREAAQRKAS